MRQPRRRSSDDKLSSCRSGAFARGLSHVGRLYYPILLLLLYTRILEYYHYIMFREISNQTVTYITFSCQTTYFYYYVKRTLLLSLKRHFYSHTKPRDGSV